MKLFIRYHCQHVGKLIHSFFQVGTHHLLHEEVEVGINRHFDFAACSACGQHLHPQLETHRRIGRRELHAFLRFSIHYLQRNRADRTSGHTDRVGRELHLKFVKSASLVYIAF